MEFVPGDRSGFYTCVIPNKQKQTVPAAAQEGGLDTPEPAPLRSGAGRSPTGPAEGSGDGVAGSQSRQDAEPRQGSAAVQEDPTTGSSSTLTPDACVAVPNTRTVGPRGRGVTGPRGGSQPVVHPHSEIHTPACMSTPAALLSLIHI